MRTNRILTIVALFFSFTFFAACKKKYPDMNVTSASITVNNGITLDIGTVNLNSSEDDNKVDYVVESNGTKDLNIESIALSGTSASNFTLDKSNFSNGTIAKGSSKVFGLSLKTNTAGTYSASLIIKSDAKDKGTFTINLSGVVQ